MATSMMSKSRSTKLQHFMRLLLYRNFIKSLNVRTYCSNVHEDKEDFFGIPEDYKLQQFRHSSPPKSKPNQPADAGAGASAKSENENLEKIDNDGPRNAEQLSAKHPHLVEEYHSSHSQSKSKRSRRERRMMAMDMDPAQKVSNYQTHFGMVSVDQSQIEANQSIQGRLSMSRKSNAHQTLAADNIFQVITKTKPPQSRSPQSHQDSSSSMATSTNMKSSSRRWEERGRNISDAVSDRKIDRKVKEISGQMLGTDLSNNSDNKQKNPWHGSGSQTLTGGNFAAQTTTYSNNTTTTTEDSHFSDIDSQYFHSKELDVPNQAPISSIKDTVNHEVSSSRNGVVHKNNSSENNLFDEHYFQKLSSESRSDPREVGEAFKRTQSSSRNEHVFQNNNVSNRSENNLFDDYYFPELSSDDSRSKQIEARSSSMNDKESEFNSIDDQYFRKTDISTPDSSVFSDFVSAYDVNKDVPSDIIQEVSFDVKPVFTETAGSKPTEIDENTKVVTNKKFLFKKKFVEKQRNLDSTSAFDLAMEFRENFNRVPNTPVAKILDSSQADGVVENKKEPTDSKGFRILSNQASDFHKMPSMDVLETLKKSIVFNNEDFLVIDKPSGLPSIGQVNDTLSLSSLLPAFGRVLPRKYKASDLHIVQALDRDVSGNVILAKNPEVAYMLKGQFKNNEIIQRYWAITKGVPSPRSGMIDIPIGEGKVGNIYKRVLRPEFSVHVGQIGKKTSRAHCDRAVTEYNVLSSHLQASLVECRLHTSGVKHQMRVHLSNGLNTPILGDHKYSHFSKLAPQKLDRSTLELLQVRQAKVRHLSLHLHCHTLVLPDYKSRTYVITSHLPSYFAQNMKSLKLYIPRK